MNKYLIPFLLLFILLAGCSKDETPSSPNTEKKAAGFIRGEINGNSWYSDNITFDEKNNTTYINAVGNSANSEIRFRLINIKQPQVYGIGENEPGYIYFVKADFISKLGGSSNTLNAYHLDYSIMEIVRYTDKLLEANFRFKAFNAAFTDSIEVSNGKIDITF